MIKVFACAKLSKTFAVTEVHLDFHDVEPSFGTKKLLNIQGFCLSLWLEII
jgi:hypothetical protein